MQESASESGCYTAIYVVWSAFQAAKSVWTQLRGVFQSDQSELNKESKSHSNYTTYTNVCNSSSSCTPSCPFNLSLCVFWQEELILKIIDDPNCTPSEFRHSYLRSTLVLILVTLMVRTTLWHCLKAPPVPLFSLTQYDLIRKFKQHLNKKCLTQLKSVWPSPTTIMSSAVPCGC